MQLENLQLDIDEKLSTKLTLQLSSSQSVS